MSRFSLSHQPSKFCDRTHRSNDPITGFYIEIRSPFHCFLCFEIANWVVNLVWLKHSKVPWKDCWVRESLLFILVADGNILFSFLQLLCNWRTSSCGIKFGWWNLNPSLQSSLLFNRCKLLLQAVLITQCLPKVRFRF